MNALITVAAVALLVFLVWLNDDVRDAVVEKIVETVVDQLYELVESVVEDVFAQLGQCVVVVAIGLVGVSARSLTYVFPSLARLAIADLSTSLAEHFSSTAMMLRGSRWFARLHCRRYLRSTMSRRLGVLAGHSWFAGRSRRR